MNVKKTKKFKENRPENYHVHDRYDMPMTASTRSMRHTAAVSARLFVMLEHERQRVRSLEMSN